MEKNHGAPDPEMPFRIAILGDFSGRENRSIFEHKLASRKPLLVDRDNFAQVLKKLDVEIRLPILGKESPPVRIKFSGLDDFHPDRLFENLEVFQALRETRQSLKDPSTFAVLTQDLQCKDKTHESSVPPIDTKKSLNNKTEQIPGNLLEQVLEETQGKKPEKESYRGPSEWDNCLHQIVKPHLVPKTHPQQAEMLSAVDAATGELMRMILHHPDFQALEAAWRAVYFLVSRLETDSNLKVYLLDITKAELAADLSASEDLRSTETYKLLVEQAVETFGGEPWAVLTANYTFDQGTEYIGLLGRMAKIAKAAGAPFISAASDKVLGCECLAETSDPDNWIKPDGTEGNKTWEILRKLPESSYLGLILPGFLLRLPYGAETNPTEGFAFEELPDAPNHNYYLWGNPSIVCVCLLGQTFAQYGWNFQSGIIQDIEGLPLHVYKQDGESLTKPCAEVVFTERAVETILDKGIMPLLSYKNQDIIRLARLQSLAVPPTQLAGRWI
ncbi:MAG: type VI secretion system contractile sheath large subunit [Planctomycetia bacterium]|nr:type VI secretion system contractile sheath large subunit [Planctomycetia bacterium]